MAALLYVASTSERAGKSALCLALARRFISYGLAVGYMKPLCTTSTWEEGRLVCEDAHFAARYLNLKEPPETLSPICLDPLLEIPPETDSTIDLTHRVQKAYQSLSKGKDLLLLEGSGSLGEGAAVGLTLPRLARRLKAPVLLTTRYTHHPVLDEIIMAHETLGDMLMGVVINMVPRQRIPYMHEIVAPFLAKKEITLLGVIPEDPLLHAISARCIAETLDGQIICRPDRCDTLIEHVLIGAMTVDSAIEYMQRTPNKAVLTGGDRADIQLAALETGTLALILTGNLRPSNLVLGHAEKAGVPIVLVPQDTMTAAAQIEKLRRELPIRHERKIERFALLLQEHFDFATLYRLLRLR